LVHGEKMSKSKGNFYTLRDLLEKGCDPAAIRYALLSVHYRAPLNFTLEGLREAGEAVKKLDDCFFQCWSYVQNKDSAEEGPVSERINLDGPIRSHLQKIREEGLGQDLNISAALAQLFDLVSLINALCAQPEKNSLASMRAAVDFFGQVDRLFGFTISFDEALDPEVADLFKKRHQIRRDPDFRKNREIQQQSDSLRDKIQAKGWVIKDARPGQLSSLKKKRRVWD